jgi:hypothetical protein
LILLPTRQNIVKFLAKSLIINEAGALLEIFQVWITLIPGKKFVILVSALGTRNFAAPRLRVGFTRLPTS